MVQQKTADNGGLNDAQELISQLTDSEAFLRFKLDEKNRVTCIAWAFEEQRLNALRYCSIIIQDNTFNTNV